MTAPAPAELPDPADVDEPAAPDLAAQQLELVARVLAFHSARLRELADAHREDARFVTGVAWGLYALRRVERAARGSTDLRHLGLLPPLPDQEGTPVLHTILRYRVPLTYEAAVQLPAGATLLHLGPPRDGRTELDLWAIVDADAPTETRILHVIGTGQPTPDPRTYVGTVPTHGGQYIWHVFDAGVADDVPGAR